MLAKAVDRKSALADVKDGVALDLQEATAVLEAQVRDMRDAQKKFEAFVTAQEEEANKNSAEAPTQRANAAAPRCAG